MPRRVPDLSRFKKLIRYQPTMDLDRTVESIIDHHRNNELVAKA